jgi:aryl-alcohol dehydrogenase-like predicted oxidoreductase
MTLRPEGSERYQVDAVDEALERLETWAALRGFSTAAVATAWLLHVPEVTAVVVGPNRVSHLDDVRASLELAMTRSELDELAGWFS